MCIFTKTGQLIQRLIRGSIHRLWVQPIESLLIPRLSVEKPNWMQSILLRLAMWCADAGRVLMVELRLNVFRWIGPDWSVAYIGDGFSAEVIRNTFFLEPIETTEHFRTYLWQVPRLIRSLSTEGDLVVCELSRIIHLSSKHVKWSFTTPQWVKQVIDSVDRPVDELLAKFDKQTRSRIRRLESQNYDYIITDSEADFTLFYHRMYIPYIEARHGGRGAIIRSYEYVHSYFEKGALLMIRRGGETICGSIFQLKAGTCIGTQMGVIDGRLDLVKQDANIAMWWYIINWAHDHGAHRFDLGGSRPMTKDGAFVFKRQWGTKVIRYQEIYSQWNFFGNDISAKLIDYVNQQGFISEISGAHYQVMLIDPEKNFKDTDFVHRLNSLTRYGLEGIVMITPIGEQRFLRSTAMNHGPAETVPLEAQHASVH